MCANCIECPALGYSQQPPRQLASDKQKMCNSKAARMPHKLLIANANRHPMRARRCPLARMAVRKRTATRTVGPFVATSSRIRDHSRESAARFLLRDQISVICVIKGVSLPQLLIDRIQAAEESAGAPYAVVCIEAGEPEVHAVLSQLECRRDFSARLRRRTLVEE